MRRYPFAIAVGVMSLLALAACGGADTAATQRAQRATVGAVSDAATVTAFAKGQTSATPGGQGGTGIPGTPTTSTGKGPVFTFATIAVGGGTTNGTSGTNGTNGTAGRSTAAGATTRPNASPSGRATVAGVRGNTYTDPQGRFTFAIPPGWLVQPSSSPDVDVEAAPPNLRGGFRLASDTMPADASLDDYGAAMLNTLQSSFTNFQLVPNSNQKGMIGGQPALRYEFTGTQSGTDLHGVVYVVDNGGTAYALFIAAATTDFDAINNQVKALLDSFTFL